MATRTKGRDARARVELAARQGFSLLRDAQLVWKKARARGALAPALSAAFDPSLWALTLMRGSAALQALAGSSFGLSLLLRVGFHIDVWTDQIGPGLRLPHPFNIVIGGGVSLGSDCTVLHGVTVQHAENTRIARGVFLSSHATVLAESTVGEGSLIGAGSVVRGVIPAGCVAVGAPARVVRPAAPGEAS